MKREKVAPQEQTGLRFTFRALQYRNYRLFFGGQSISLIGTWMQRTAMGWLVYRMTHSALLLGLIGFADQIPFFFIAPPAGVLLDRWNRQRVLLVTQSLALLQALILAVLVLTGTVAVWHIVFMALFLGSVNAFDMPARQAFLVEMVEDKRILGNAIALNSTMVHVARMVGPSVAGLFIAAFGEGMCFLANAVSYIAVIVSLVLMNIAWVKTNSKRLHVLRELQEGLTYAFGFAPIKSIILLVGLLSLTGAPYMVLMPVFAKDVLHGGPHTLGFLIGSSGVGALMGALYLASRKNVLGLERMIALASGMFGASLMAFSHSRSFSLSLILLPVAGFSMILQIASSNTILQTIVEDDKRGRIMSLFTMAFMGMVPFGSLLAGCLASKIGAPNTLLLGGACCVLGSALFARKLPALRKMVRPIYIKMGIIRDGTA